MKKLENLEIYHATITTLVQEGVIKIKNRITEYYQREENEELGTFAENLYQKLKNDYPNCVGIYVYRMDTRAEWEIIDYDNDPEEGEDLWIYKPENEN